jgi:hypothetical protein
MGKMAPVLVFSLHMITNSTKGSTGEDARAYIEVPYFKMGSGEFNIGGVPARALASR